MLSREVEGGLSFGFQVGGGRNSVCFISTFLWTPSFFVMLMLINFYLLGLFAYVLKQFRA